MNPLDLLKNTQALKEQAEQFQKELGELTAEGSSGGRMVTVKINGHFEMTEIHLDPICVDNRDIKMLEDLIVAAQHDAITEMQKLMKEKSGSLLHGLNIPGL
ncbi:MAG: YbaB/EbfC family nucleoid-associated protein [Treponemataceae bacterium]|nr:YbaB/EbfC family nucleoid-associated protein [Treponemataceae bacterium]